MAKLSKTNNGLLFFDDFSEKTLMWTLSPSDANCISFGDNGLQIKHNKRYVSYTIVEPKTEEYSCIVELDHVPFNFNDIAGVLVMSNTREYAECQSYMAKNPSELTNSDPIFIEDVEAVVDKILSERNYIQWAENDEEINDTILDSINNTNKDSNFVDVIYRYIKFTKTKYKYVFWASQDGISWIEVGNVKFENSGVIGFFVYGAKEQELLDNSHCYFKSFALYQSKYITIDGIDRKSEMEICDGNGTVLMRTDNIGFAHMISRSSKQCVINTITLPAPIKNAKLRIYPKGNYAATIAEYDLGEEVYGGDAFVIEKDIRLFIDNQEINTLELYNLGTFYRGSYFIKVDVHNYENYALNDVKIKIIKYSEYYGGEEEIAVALYDENRIESELVYNKEIIIDEIRPSEGRSFYMKLTDRPIQDFYMTANSYRFKIVIE